MIQFFTLHCLAKENHCNTFPTHSLLLLLPLRNWDAPSPHLREQRKAFKHFTLEKKKKYGAVLFRITNLKSPHLD